jgi:hypothetical protein
MSFRDLQITIVIDRGILIVRVVSALSGPSSRFLFLQIIERSQVPRVVMRVIIRELDLCVRENHSFLIHWFVIVEIFSIFIHCATIPD